MDIEYSKQEEQSMQRNESAPWLALQFNSNTSFGVVEGNIQYQAIIENLGSLPASQITLRWEPREELKWLDSMTLNGAPITGKLAEGIVIEQISTGEKKLLEFDVEIIALPEQRVLEQWIWGSYQYEHEEGIQYRSIVSERSLLPVEYPKIQLNLTRDKDEVVVGHPFHYQLEVINQGTIDLEELMLSQEGLEEVEWLAVALNGGEVEATIREGFLLGNLPEGYRTVVDLMVQIQSAEDLPLSGELQVWGRGLVGPDQKIVLVGEKIPLAGPTHGFSPKLDISLQGQCPYATMKERYSYQICVYNTGDLVLEQVFVQDQLAEGLLFVPGSVKVDGVPVPKGNICEGILVEQLFSGEEKNIEFLVEIQAALGQKIKTQARTCFSYPVECGQPGHQEVLSNCYEVKVVEGLLTMKKESNKERVYTGETLTYQLKIKNQGQELARNIIVSDPLFQEVSWLNKMTLNGESLPGNIEEGVDIGELAAGSEAILAFEVRVDQVPPQGILCNQSEAEYQYQSRDGCGIAFNAMSNIHSVVVDDASMRVEKQASLRKVCVGESYQYEIVVRNTGNTDLCNLILTDELPMGLRVSAILVNGGIVEGDLAVGIPLGNLPRGYETIVTIIVEVSESLAGQEMINTAKVVAQVQPDGCQPGGYISAQGTTPWPTEICVVGLSLEKESDKTEVVVGEVILFSITAKNTGTIPLNQVIIQDYLDEQLVFIPHSVNVNGQEQLEGDIRCGVDLGDLLPLEETLVTFKAKVSNHQCEWIINQAKGMYRYCIKEKEFEKGEAVSNQNKIELLKGELLLTKTANKDVVCIQDRVKYSANIKNAGKLVATSVRYKDQLPCELELIPDTVKVDGEVVPVGDLSKGIGIPDIPPRGKVQITYETKVIASNAKKEICNCAEVDYRYRLAEGISDRMDSKDQICILVKNAIFKQFMIQQYVDLPWGLPEIQCAKDGMGEIIITQCKLVETKKGKSISGQQLTGEELVVQGIANVRVSYISTQGQAIQWVDYGLPFSTSLVLPNRCCGITPVDLNGLIEKISVKSVGCNKLYISIATLISGE